MADRTPHRNRTAPVAPHLPTQPAHPKLPIKRKKNPAISHSAAAASPTPRIWSESDEIRFLQGLLGCSAQGLVFPRDLNVFFDRFSESMPHPYTRSQLSEKLRRLRNKHRSLSSRIAAAGGGSSRLLPHDSDVLHLCSRLWDPAHAEASPFFASSPFSNRRRLPNPCSPSSAPPDSISNSPSPPPSVPRDFADPIETSQEKQDVEKRANKKRKIRMLVLDVFQECLEDFRSTGAETEGIDGRWRELRFAEMEVCLQRLRSDLTTDPDQCKKLPDLE